MKKQYLDGIDVVYWINLDRAKDRKEHMEKNVINDEIFEDKKVIRLKPLHNSFLMTKAQKTKVAYCLCSQVVK